jgi:ATP-dependent Lon protease
MDAIHLSGYTEDEKFWIATKYLVPKQLDAHGLSADQVKLSENAIRLVIREYTREAGVRNLERQLAAICRKAAREFATGREKGIRVDERKVRTWLGPRRFAGEVRKRTSDAGVATGLAVTAVGGDVLFIEAQAYPGEGRLTVTGQLGEVMQESARAAHSWVRAHAEQLGLQPQWFSEHDIHVHVPAGAIPKDGPSAGITMATAIVSLARGKPVSEDVAMTGEITLTGQVLQIGGVREKALAAQRAGIKTVVMPRDNEPDIEDLPREVARELDFVLADSIDQVLEVAFDGARRGRPQTAATERQAAMQARGASA